MFTNLSSQVQTSEYIIKNLYIIKDYDKAEFIINYFMFTAVNVTDNNISNLTVSAKTEISENIINEFNLTVSVKTSKSNLTVSTINILSVSTIIFISINLTVLIAINAVNLNSESIIINQNDNSDKLLENILLNIIHRSVSYWNLKLQ